MTSEQNSLPAAENSQILEIIDDAEEPVEKKETTEKTEKSLADKVEDTIRALLNFVHSYFHTLRFVISFKRLAGYDVLLHKKDVLLVRPLTFLCCSFIPTAVILDLSSDTIWDYLLSPELAATQIIERLQNISPLKIVMTAVPALIAVYLGASMLARLVIRERENRNIFVSGLCYAFGAQFFGTTILTLIVLLGHARISEQFIPAVILEPVLNVLAAGYVFYVLLVMIAVYPSLVAGRMVRSFYLAGRHWPHILAAVFATVAITMSLYWLGGLPSRFRAATTTVVQKEIALADNNLKINTDKPPAIEVIFLVTNPTQSTVLIQTEDGFSIRLRMKEDGPSIPKNMFSVKVSSHKSSYIILRHDDAMEVDGKFYPDGNDWKLIEDTLAKDELIYAEVTLHDKDGKKTISGWTQITLTGTMPVLTAVSR